MCVEVVEVAVEVLDDVAAWMMEVVRRVVHLRMVVRLWNSVEKKLNYPLFMICFAACEQVLAP